MIYKIKDISIVAPFFKDWQETLIWSCIDGIMGEIYGDDIDNPQSVMAWIADFCFFAGKPNQELIMYVSSHIDKEVIILVPYNESWGTMIEIVCGDTIDKITRYATKKDTYFNKERLQNIVASLPSHYSLQAIDEKRFLECKEQKWSSDLVGQYKSYKDFKRLGLGQVICKDGKIVAGASSYTRYSQGIEIEIDTKKEFRKQGLAYICGAALILQCLEQNLYPSWDAHTRISLSLAKKLGYEFAYEYSAYIKQNKH